MLFEKYSAFIYVQYVAITERNWYTLAFVTSIEVYAVCCLLKDWNWSWNSTELYGMMYLLYRAAAVDLAEDASILHQLRDISYSEQYDILFTGKLDAKKVQLPLLLRWTDA